MKTLVLVTLSLLASQSVAGSFVGPRVPEPEMWALLGVAAAAFGASRWLRRRNGKARK